MNISIQELLTPTDQHLAIVWSDGAQSIFTWCELRRACRCAGCIDEITGKKLLDPDSVSTSLGCTKISRVGNYGLQFAFSDRHDTGIYTYDILRGLNLES